MTDNQFDDFIRAKLQDHSAPVPAGLWDKVNPAKKDDGRKGTILPKINRFGLMVITVLLLGTAGGYLYFNSRHAATADQAAVTKEQPTHTTTATGSNHPDQPGQAQKTPISTTPEKINSDVTDSRVSAPLAGKETTAGMNTGITANNNNTVAGSEMKKNNKNNNINNTATNTREFQNRANRISGHTQEQIATAALSDQEEVVEDIPAYNSQVRLAVPVRSFHAELFNMTAPYDLQLKAGNHTKKFPNIIICPSNRGGNRDWFAEVYLSPGIAFKSIENKTSTPQYLQKKDSSERMQPGYAAGIRLVKPINANLLLKTGLEYVQVNEKFTYRTENEITTTTVITVRTIIRAPGDTIMVSDTSVVQQIGYKTNSIRNRYRSIDIPLTVGYQFGNENLRIGVNAGVIFNISSWYQGVVLDSSLSTVPIGKGSNMMYKKNIGLGLYAGFSLLKKLNEDTQLFFEPYFRYNLSSMTNSQASFNQRISVGGLSIGLRYNLNRQ